MYSLIRPALFALDPERAHDLTMGSLAHVSSSDFATQRLAQCFSQRVPDLPVDCMGLSFRHPIGLAAGLDKDARALPALSALGFSGVELGTVTPLPQPGNEKPRLFRLPENEALINRMGFNSAGLDAFLGNLKKTTNTAVVGINIGKNATRPVEDAHLDYVAAMSKVYSQADYITVNISSPNTQSLRDLQNADYLDHLLLQLHKTRQKCAKVSKRVVPIALKVSPDLGSDEIETISELVVSHQLDAVIATNTTTDRPDSLRGVHADEGGGLSGAPVRQKSTECIREFYKHLGGQVPIIGVGGIATADDAWEKLLAGADFLQVYSQFIYRGPTMIRDIVEGLKNRVTISGHGSLEAALKALR